jgi:molybdopterin-guanine dinucleotide biosynthesis protein A
MQRDKAAIAYHGQETQLESAMKLLAPRVARAFVSVRADQADDPVRSAWPRIVDRGDVEGPIAGISAALATTPTRRGSCWPVTCRSSMPRRSTR